MRFMYGRLHLRHTTAPFNDNHSAGCIVSDSLTFLTQKHYNKTYDWHGLTVKVFNAEEYNDVLLKKGKIYHWKGKRHEKGIYEKLIVAQREGKDVYQMFNQLTGRKISPLSRFSNWLTGI